MPKITVEDESKVMDVASPGKGKIVGTSRPVVGQIASDESKKPEASATVPNEEPTQALAPSVTHKIIQPISKEEEQPKEVSETGEEAVVEAEKSEKPEEPEAAVASEKAEPEKAETTDSEASDAASVDALAGSVNSKKENAKKAEEQSKRDAELQELIDSKKYVVPIGKEGPMTVKSGNKGSGVGLVLLLIIIVAIVATYLLIDAGIIGTTIELPLDLIK